MDATATTARPATIDQPISAGERLQIVDILRGFALLGILLVNMAIFKAPFGFGEPAMLDELPLLDRLAQQAITLFAEGKFFTLFSLLFGFGFAIQMLRAEQRGRPFVGRFARRLLILLVIGLIHAFLIWYGDILVSYALIGFALLLFRNARPRTLLIWAALLLLGMTVIVGGLIALLEFARAVPGVAEQMRQVEQQTIAQFEQQFAEDQRVYGSGSYAEIVAYRARFMPIVYFSLLFQWPPVLAMFLLGLYAGKRGILHDPGAHLALLRRVRFWGLTLGLALSLLVVILQARLSLLGGAMAPLLNFSIAGPVLSLGYAATIVLLAQRPAWLRRLTPLAPVGRMALTNYLLQSLIATTIFYGYGLGLYGRWGAATGLLLSLAIYALQIPFSNWWLSRFRFGPLEWLWRSLTYGRAQQMRLAPATR